MSEEFVLVKLKAEDWFQCAGLFKCHTRLRGYIDAAFEGYFDGFKDGVEILVDEAVNPRIACLRVGSDVLVGGDPSSTNLGELCSGISASNSHPDWHTEFTGELVTPENEPWETAILSATDRKTLKRKKRAYSARFLDLDHLTDLTSRLQPGLNFVDSMWIWPKKEESTWKQIAWPMSG